MTDIEVEKEIERLTKDEYVKLARAEQYLRYRRRQYLCKLRSLYKKGQELSASGYTLENIRELMSEMEENPEKEQ